MTCYTKTDNMMIGNFFEILDDSGSYRVEHPGLYIIHYLIAALCLFCKIENLHTKVNGDKQGVL